MRGTDGRRCGDGSLSPLVPEPFLHISVAIPFTLLSFILASPAPPGGLEKGANYLGYKYQPGGALRAPDLASLSQCLAGGLGSPGCGHSTQ